jgi:hypothetical protein
MFAVACHNLTSFKRFVDRCSKVSWSTSFTVDNSHVSWAGTHVHVEFQTLLFIHRQPTVKLPFDPFLHQQHHKVKLSWNPFNPFPHHVISLSKTIPYTVHPPSRPPGHVDYAPMLSSAPSKRGGAWKGKDGPCKLGPSPPRPIVRLLSSPHAESNLQGPNRCG